MGALCSTPAADEVMAHSASIMGADTTEAAAPRGSPVANSSLTSSNFPSHDSLIRRAEIHDDTFTSTATSASLSTPGSGDVINAPCQRVSSVCMSSSGRSHLTHPAPTSTTAVFVPSHIAVALERAACDLKPTRLRYHSDASTSDGDCTLPMSTFPALPRSDRVDNPLTARSTEPDDTSGDTSRSACGGAAALSAANSAGLMDAAAASSPFGSFSGNLPSSSSRCRRMSSSGACAMPLIIPVEQCIDRPQMRPHANMPCGAMRQDNPLAAMQQRRGSRTTASRDDGSPSTSASASDMIVLPQPLSPHGVINRLVERNRQRAASLSNDMEEYGVMDVPSGSGWQHRRPQDNDFGAAIPEARVMHHFKQVGFGERGDWDYAPDDNKRAFRVDSESDAQGEDASASVFSSVRSRPSGGDGGEGGGYHKMCIKDSIDRYRSLSVESLRDQNDMKISGGVCA